MANPISSFYGVSQFPFDFRSDAQRAAKQKEAKERELEHAAFSADRIEEGGFPPVSMVSNLVLHLHPLAQPASLDCPVSSKFFFS